VRRVQTPVLPKIKEEEEEELNSICWVPWLMPVMLAKWRLRAEGSRFKDSQGK
jgi:hypothetical protein